MLINSAECASNLKNTGFQCPFVPGFIVGFGRVGDNFKIDAAVAASPTALRAYLMEASLADDPTERFYPVHGTRTITNNSEATVVQTMGDGGQVVVRQGYYNFTLQFTEGGFCLHNALLSWNNLPGNFIFWDQNGYIMGTIATDETGARYITGVPLVFNQNPWGFNDGSNVASFVSSFSFPSSYLNENLGFVKSGFPISSIKGLQTLVIQQGTAAPAAGVLRLKVVTGCDYSNVFTKYSTELADETLWIVRNAATQAEIDITSVTADSGNLQFVVTLDATDSDYPTSPAALVTVTFVGPTELNAADIPSFEGNILSIARG